MKDKWVNLKYPGFEKYKASYLGKIKNPRGKFIKGHQEPKGYIRIKLSCNKKTLRKYAHVIIAEHFVPNPNPESYDQVDHINHKRDDNPAYNLRWSNNHLNQLNRRDRLAKLEPDNKDNFDEK